MEQLETRTSDERNPLAVTGWLRHSSTLFAINLPRGAVHPVFMVGEHKGQSVPFRVSRHSATEQGGSDSIVATRYRQTRHA